MSLGLSKLSWHTALIKDFFFKHLTVASANLYAKVIREVLVQSTQAQWRF